MPLQPEKLAKRVKYDLAKRKKVVVLACIYPY